MFVDEIDAVGRSRGTGVGGGNDEREQTLNQLLTEMDGFEGNTGIIVIAATNRADILDNALLRPGRFDRQVCNCCLPCQVGSITILGILVHARPSDTDADISIGVQVTVDVPDQKGRLAILKVHAKNKKLSDEVDLSQIAMRTPGFSGADLANLLNEVRSHCVACHSSAGSRAQHADLRLPIFTKSVS